MNSSSNFDHRYKDAVQHASSFNAQLSRERRLRLPFLDSQTGVAQNHSQLLHTQYQRKPGIPTYPYDFLK